MKRPAIVAGGSSAALLMVVLAAMAAGPPELPLDLPETGLYAADGGVDPANRPYSPQYPLWTDGAAKARWIYLPPGSRIDVSDTDAWGFPVGTKLWKEFSFAGRKVETRLLWLRAKDEWVFASYAWDDGQTGARLAPEDGIARAFEVAPGRWHSIPSRTDCLSCHGGGAAIVLGFGALQLSEDRDALAPHAEPLPAGALTLGGLVREDLLEPPRPDLLEHPPVIGNRDPVERAALGYLSANCGSCHNGAGPLNALGLHLDSGIGEATGTIDARGIWEQPGLPTGGSRIVAPGQPERSTVVYRMASRWPSSQMPPLGSVLVDEEGLQLVREWISNLPSARLP